MSNSNLQIARELLDNLWSIHNPSALSDIKKKLINFLLNKGVEYVKTEEIYISFFRELINANYENEENLIYYSTMILDLIFDKMEKEIGGFKFLLKDLFAVISDKTSLSKNIKTVFKLKFHNDYQSVSEVIDIVKSPHELWEFKYKNLVLLDNKNCMSYKTPPIIHQLWLIRGENIKEIADVNIDHIKHTHELLTKSTYEWQHILWTNNKELMPDSIQKLIAMGIEIREINDYKYVLPKYSLIQKNIKIPDIGKAVDILKYAVIYKFGGVYADLNYIFFKNLDAEICNFNFITTSLDHGFSVENYFFIASKKHPIIKLALNDIERNLSPETAPLWLHEYYQYNQTTCDVSTDLFTYMPFQWAIYKAGNKNGNIDAIYPPQKVDKFEMPGDYFDYNTALDFVLNKLKNILDISSYQLIEASIKDSEYNEAEYTCIMEDVLLGSCMASYPFNNDFLIGKDGNGNGGSWTTYDDSWII